ncbi:type B chloramphenicol O-acetyltransferase [Nocardiopsis mangrovi]|uniref:Type B chloramphenicol O-acetyltransferase n=1 Tax=Nocardiopsis mangrovi TaxID=1179818 RepID=A0ABV9E5W0_9ACTN
MFRFTGVTEVQRLEADPDVLSHTGIVLAEGRHSWYAGYHHGEGFAARVRYAPPGLAEYNGQPTDRLRIGNFCQFASGTQFMLGGNHGHDLGAVTPYGFNFFQGAADRWRPSGDTVVGHEVWIGYEALVLPGVRLGTGSVIGARAVVARDVPPFAVVVGDGRVVRHRFDPLTRRLLWRTAWWNWPDDRIGDALPLLQGRDARALARYAGVGQDDVADDPDPITLLRAGEAAASA